LGDCDGEKLLTQYPQEVEAILARYPWSKNARR
jgi:hypothetical protein